MTEEDNLQKTVIAELRSLRNDMERIAGFIVEMRRDYSVLEDKMELSSSDVIRLLGIFAGIPCPMEGHQRNPVQVYIMQPRCLSVQGTLRRHQERTCLLQGFQTSGSPTTAQRLQGWCP